MPKHKSNRDFSIFKADILRLSERGLKVRLFNKITKDWQIMWLPKSEIEIGGKDEIKIPIWLALKNKIL